MKAYKKKISKIYNRIDSIASKGRDNQIEYYDYISELIKKGDYDSFEEVLYLYYDIDIKNIAVEEYKLESWILILEVTKSPFLTKLSRLYKKSGIYQSSFNIHKDIDGVLLGKIIEIEILGENSKYYIENRQYARLIGERKTNLQVIKENGDSIIIEISDNNTSEDNNLITRYKMAIEFLKG